MEDYTEDDWDWDWRDDQILEEMGMCTISGHNVSFKTIITRMNVQSLDMIQIYSVNIQN